MTQRTFAPSADHAPPLETALHTAQAENRQLRAAILALRERLQLSEADAELRVGQARIDAQSELAQLRATVAALRAALEAAEALASARLEAAALAAQHERVELQALAQVLRAEIDAQAAAHAEQRVNLDHTHVRAMAHMRDTVTALRRQLEAAEARSQGR